MRTVSGRTDRVVVVGAGFAGLSAALHLAGRGRRVELLERECVPGGRAGRLDMLGYRVDTGPTVLTMPDILEGTFAAAGARMSDHVELLPVDPAYRAVFADGSSLAVHSDAAAMTEEIRAFSGAADAAGYQRLRAWLTELYRVEFDRFIAANLDSPLSLLAPELPRLVAMGAFGRLDRAIGRFLSDPRLRRVFSFQALYAGVSPHRALAAYAVISYMDTVAGVWFPRGGVRAVPDGLARAAEDAGVEIHYGAEVESLERSGSRVRAVRTSDGRRFACDAAVLTVDSPVAHRLLGREPRRAVPLRPSPSAFVVHLGVRAQPGALAHHTISFGDAWRSTFHELITEGRVMRDPSLLVTRPTATDPALAPEGRDLLSVLAPVPHLRRGPIDWRTRAETYADELVSLLEDRLLPGVRASVDASHVLTPADWAERGMVAGTPFAWSHTFAQTGPFRPRNFPRSSQNVVLAGSSTVPGVGVPTALVSGRLAADRITGAGSPRSAERGPMRAMRNRP